MASNGGQISKPLLKSVVEAQRLQESMLAANARVVVRAVAYC